MALNSNHTFEDLGSLKCAVVEKNCSSERAGFLRKLLEHNKYEVVVVNSPAPKTPVKPTGGTDEAQAAIPATFTVGVTDLSFNPMNAIYNRELKAQSGEVVSPAYWKQQTAVVNQEAWYWK